MTDQAASNIAEELNNLEQQVEKISRGLNSMKEKNASGKRISLEELQLTVNDINQLDVVMRERQDVGH